MAVLRPRATAPTAIAHVFPNRILGIYSSSGVKLDKQAETVWIFIAKNHGAILAIQGLVKYRLSP
jgi:hypothetical protein